MNQVLGFEGYLVFLVTFSPFGEGQFFDGDEVFGVKGSGHNGEEDTGMGKEIQPMSQEWIHCEASREGPPSPAHLIAAGFLP